MNDDAERIDSLERRLRLMRSVVLVTSLTSLGMCVLWVGTVIALIVSVVS